MARRAWLACQIGPREARASGADQDQAPRCNGAAPNAPERTEPANPKRLGSERHSKPCLGGPWPREAVAYRRVTRRCLTFELRGRNRHGAWPARRTIDQSASRAKCHAGGGPWLERRVRPHCLAACWLCNLATDLQDCLVFSRYDAASLERPGFERTQVEPECADAL